jgi:quercetin dioxygenase-like cupin family protein
MKFNTAYLGNEDDRGSIFDLEFDESIGAVGHVTFEQDAVRGNHIHNRTTQWNYIVSGSLTATVVDVDGARHDVELRPGDLLKVGPGEAHAFKALEPTHMMVFTMGPRAGKEYESDTFRLDTRLL